MNIYRGEKSWTILCFHLRYQDGEDFVLMDVYALPHPVSVVTAYLERWCIEQMERSVLSLDLNPNEHA
jgi:hypothetical protein